MSSCSSYFTALCFIAKTTYEYTCACACTCSLRFVCCPGTSALSFVRPGLAPKLIRHPKLIRCRVKSMVLRSALRFHSPRSKRVGVQARAPLPASPAGLSFNELIEKRVHSRSWSVATESMIKVISRSDARRGCSTRPPWGTSRPFAAAFPFFTDFHRQCILPLQMDE